MKTIVVLMDTLNRRMLEPYNPQTWVKTPNISRIAKRSVVFENHWSGSLPCMPARRDLLTGRLAFLEKGWGAIEPFDVTLPALLRQHGIYSHIVTDHYHYFCTGGENYCQSFDTWDFHRGQENDGWVSRVNGQPARGPYYGRIDRQYELNRTRLRAEEDYSGPRTFAAAIQWLQDNRGADDYFLTVEAFDPHEPFDCPREYLDLYADTYTGPHYDWPRYAPAEEPAEAVDHILKRYAATLTMTDRWFGKLLDTMDELALWDDTLLILTTDHGFLLGEHGFMAKNYMPVYNELAHIPLIVHWPGGQRAGERVGALTQTIDLFPTVLERFGIPVPGNIHGISFAGLWGSDMPAVRSHALYGYHGMAVNLTDGRYTYFRAPQHADNHPCHIYTAMPTTFRQFLNAGDAADIKAGRFLPYTDFPVFRIPFSRPGEEQSRTRFVRQNTLYDIDKDYEQIHPLDNKELEEQFANHMREAMRRHDAPPEQYIRLGL